MAAQQVGLELQRRARSLTGLRRLSAPVDIAGVDGHHDAGHVPGFV
jgi:hypothetical protein